MDMIKSKRPKRMPIRDVAAGSYLFDSLWKAKKFKQAVRIYFKIGKPFWLAEDVGHYLEGHGRISEAMLEHEYLIGHYQEMKILPLPGGPLELLKLARWYSKRSPSMAKRYLKIYLSAEKDQYGTGRKIKFRAQAEKLLRQLAPMKTLS